MLEQDIKDFIEQNIEYLDDGVEVFLKQAHSMNVRNTFMYKLCRALEDAGIDTDDARESLLYDLVAQMCIDAMSSGWRGFHDQMIDYLNWYGYSPDEVVEHLEKWAYNLNVKLVPTNESRFAGVPNFDIYEFLS